MTETAYLLIETDADRINALEFSADGATLAAAALGGTFLLWKIDETVEKRIDFETGDPLHQVALHPNGRIAATCGEGAVKIWDISNATAAPALVGDSPAGTKKGDLPVATEATYRWDADAPRSVPTLVREVKTADREILSLRFSPCGRWLLTAGDSERLLLIDWETGAAIDEQRVGERNTSIVFHPDGETLAVTCSWQSGSGIRFYQLIEGRLKKLELEIEIKVDFLSDAAFSANGTLLAVPGGALEVYEYPSGRRRHAFDYNGKPILFPRFGSAAVLDKFWTRAAFTSQNELLCASPTSGRILRFDADAGKLLGAIKASESGVFAFAVQPRGYLLASAGGELAVKLQGLQA